MFHHRRHISDDHPLFARDTPELHARADCEPVDPANTLTDRLNTLLNSSGPGYTLPLCPGTQYLIQAPIQFFAPNQEISTVGYPYGDDRATFIVNGPVSNGQGHTVAVDGTCPNCSGVKLRNIQINGTRLGAGSTMGGANIEMGGSNSDQIIEYVRTYDPRSWSCLHIAEGAFSCNNVTIRHNDIGPCGSDVFQQWADGISVSCMNSHVYNNSISNPTDGGIVLFGAPGTLVENNTIWVDTQTLLGGINMVDYDPWQGNYTNTIVRNNRIVGGFATDTPEAGEHLGENDEEVIIKIGIAIGPRTWFGDRYLNNVSHSGTVMNNEFTGAFGYGIAISSSRNFTVEHNVLIGNTSFIGSRGPNCSNTDVTPSPQPFVIDLNTTHQSTTQTDFKSIPDGDALTCILPPSGGDYWPFGGNPNPVPGENPPGTTPSNQSSGGSDGLSGGVKAAIAISVVAGVAIITIAAWFIRKWALRRQIARQCDQWNRDGYIKSKEDVTNSST